MCHAFSQDFAIAPSPPIFSTVCDRKLGAVIMQEGKALAHYSHKLNKAQRNYYTMMEKELLSIVETLKEFRIILLGHEIEVSLTT
jgi:hypothetical protein